MIIMIILCYDNKDSNTTTNDNDNINNNDNDDGDGDGDDDDDNNVSPRSFEDMSPPASSRSNIRRTLL